MASAFNLTAQINLRGPSNLRPIVSQIRRQLGSIDSNINLKIDNKASKSIDIVTNRLGAMNKVLTEVRNNTISLNQSLRDLSGSLGSVQTSGNSATSGMRKTSQSVEKVSKEIKVARTEMEEFGRQSALAVRRFIAFAGPTAIIFGLTNAVTQAFKEFINFDKELVRLQQVTGRGAIGVKSLQDEITNLATGLGVSSSALLEVTTTLAQAGLTVEETRIALKALAKTELAPSFENLTKTTEGAIAAIRQFGLEAGELESALGSINAVAAAFAVESGDIIAAIQRTGGVFASASKGVSEGTDALNEFVAIFTSVRQTTRESAETIATGLRTIFTRIQRSSTIQQLKQFGVELQDVEGKFVGPFEAVRRLSEALNQLDPRDIRFSTIVEELGGFRQIGKVIPLIQQFAVAQQALGVAQRGQSSLSDAQVKAQQSLANQIAKVREQFLALIRDVGQSTVFQGFFKIVLGLTSGLISLASAFKPILPILAVFGAIKGVSAIGQFATGFFGGLKKGGGAGGAGQNIGESLSGAKEKQRAEATSKAADAIRLNTDALKSLTSAVQSLDSTIKSRGSTTLASGGKVLGFNTGGIVPGSGKGDKVPALLEPGEVVINNKAASKYGRSNLDRMNRYSWGGKVSTLTKYYKSLSAIRGYDDIKDQYISDKSKFIQVTPENLTEADKKTWTNSKLARWEKFEYLLGRKYRLGPPAKGTGFEFLDFPKARAESKFIKKGDTYGDPDTLKGNNAATIAGKNFLFANSKGTNRKPKSLEYIDISNTPVTTYWADPQEFLAAGLNNGGRIQKFMAGSRGGIDWKSLSQGRGKGGARGARDIIEPISSETYLKWAKGIYDEYDADPSLVMAMGAGGERVPPEIALANKLLTQYAFETGGAGLAVGKRFVRTPKERISDELRPYLVPDPSDPNEFGFFEDDIRKFGRAKVLSKAATAKLGRQSALEAAAARNAGYANAESAISSFKATGTLDVDPSIMGYLIQSIRNPDNLPLEPKELDKLKKKLTKPNLDAFNALVGPDKTPVGVQGQRTKLSEVFGAILETYGSDTSDLEIDNIIRGIGSKIQDKRFGGIIQKFMAGSIGGIMEQTEETLPSDLAGLIEQIAKIGGTTQLYDLVPKSEIANILKEKKVFPLPTAKQLVSSSWLTAKTPDLYGDRDKYIEPLKEVVKRARSRFNTKQSGIQAQLLRNVQAASGQGYKFGLASIYGPNGELGYSSTSNAKEIEGPDGTKYLTQIIRKSLPERYLDAARATAQDIAGVPARGAERLQYTDIFGTGGPLAFDFDETLVKGSDIPGKNPADYSDLNKVQEALKNAELTLLGKELAKRINEYPQLLDSVRVLTARPQSNAPYLATTLTRLGLPIPASKITGVSGGLNKVDNLSELETLIDDNLENIQSVISGGKRAIPYSEPRSPDLSQAASRRSIQVMEGYALEEMVKSLGVNISPDDADPLRPIDYPNGLGSYARYWDMPPNIPTDTKRTNSSSALSRLFEEAERFYAANFAFGGKADGPSFDEVRQKIIDKYPEIQFRISKRTRGFGYNLMGALKSKGGLSGDSGLNFQQPTNLKQLQEYSDKLAAKLMNPEQLAAGGLLAEPTQSTPSQTQKNFGKVALRTGNRIQATYIKEGEAAAARSGQVIADSIGGGLYAVQSSSATKGYGPKLYDIVMEAATAAGGMLTSDRRTVSDAAKAVWAYYFNNRSDVKKTPLGPENWVSNSRLLDEKLYGPPDTWPPATDPAWILQTGYSKSPSDINNPDLVQKLATGGKSNTIPAMVSNGEAFVPPQVAKKIGYANLDRMNQADRNGMGKYADGGGISVFKGPGSGTSDSIGPIGLPQGSYVIRQKATKALGLNKGGGVGVRKFAAGSPGGIAFDRSILTTIETALELEAKRLGISISDLAKELKKTADETRKAALAAGKTKAEANKAAREAAGQKIDLTTLYQSDFGFLEQQIQARPEKQTRVKAAERDLTGDQIKTQKETFTAQGRGGVTRQEAYDAGALRPDYQASGPGRGGTSTQVKLDLQTEAILLPIRKEIAQRYAKIYDEEKKAINDFYQQKVNKALAAGEEITPIVNEAKAVLAETKAKLTAGAQTEIQTATASATQTTAAASTQRMEQLQETRARAADPFYDAKKAADAFTAGGPGGGPRVNEQIRKEQQDFFAYKAEQAGQTVGGFRQNLTKQVGAQAYAIGQERQFAKTEAKNIFAGRARELKGVDFAKATAAGATGEEASKVQGIIEEFAASLRKVDPTLGLGEARQAATKLAEGLAKGDQSVAQVIAGNKKLQEVFNKTLSETENLDEAFRRVAEAAGLSEESLKAEISPQKIKEQQFISSKEGQRFGALAEFAPGLTERFSKTRIGRGLGAGADFISGKGGRLSKAFAGAGGFTGIGTGVAVGAEALKQFLPKSVTSDPNTAGALGALSGAGSGAAMGAQLGSFAGPIGTLIGGVGGAIIGGIQGFFSAKNQAILTNALENVAKTTGDLDQAFKKLEADSSKVNFEGAQKAFGDVLAAGQPIEELAFAKTGFENLGSTLTGGVDKLSTGLAEGDVGKVVLGGLQTAFGASGLGFITDYFSAPSEAQRTEAVGAMVGSGAQRNESAARLAESGLKFKSTEELGKIFDNIKTGTGELNPITEQYVQGALQAAEAANGVKQLTAAQTQQITAQAKERAALDAYMKKRKESGATDEQIAKEISSNRAAAKKEGEEAIKVQGELAAKQALLARATKEVAIATESLLDVYRRINAEAERYSSELDQFGADIDALVGGLGGDTSMRAVNRQNEQVLGNVSAYSMEEVRAAANATAGLLGGTPDAQNLANQAVGQKLVQDQIPALLRTAGKDTKAQDDALGSVENLLSSQGLDSDAIKTVLADLKNELAKGEGLSEAELQDTIQKSFSTVGKGLEALQNVTKKYNDTLQQARKFQADYNKAVLEAGSYLRKATQVRLNAELDLAKALGRSPTLEELNKPFDVEVASLTGRLVESGDLAAGAASDPMAIAAAISATERRKQEIEQGAPGLLGAAANIPAGPAGDPLRQELNQAQLDNIREIGNLTIASAEGRQALEKLANDGTKAANALAKIQEEQQALEGFAAFAQNVFTAEPQQLAQMELQATALNAAQASGPEFMQSRYNRQQAFAGLEQEKQFLTPQEYRDAQADLIRKSFEGQINPQTGQRTKGTDVVRKIGGKEFTLDQFIERIRGGVDQTDPNVVAFREASEVQAKANEALGKLNMEQAFIIQDAMLRLEFFLSSDFPQILTNAVTNAEADAQTKPEVKPETKPKGPSYNEQRLDEGKKKEAEGRRLLAEAKKEEDALGYWAGSSEVGAVNTKKRKAREMIAAGQQTVATYGPKAEADAAARAQQEAAATEAKKQAETEAKARQTEENKAKAEEAIDKAREAREGGRPVMVGSGGQTVTAAYTGSYTPRTQEEVRALADEVTEARFSGTRPPIQAPPAPGTGAQQATAQAVTPTADPIAQAIRQAQAAEASGAIERLGTSQTSKEKDIAKLEARAKAERIAAKAAGTYTGSTKSEEALASAQQDLASINEQITAEKQRLAALAEQAKLAEQGTQSSGGLDQNGTFTAPTIPLTPQQQQDKIDRLTSLDIVNTASPTASVNPSATRLPQTAPVPVTMPQQASYTNQQAVSTTGERVEDKKMAREAQAITIDSASLESLNAFNTTFGSYVDKLVTFEFPTIPDVIEMKGNHVVDVRISGAAAFEGLKKDFETMMQKEIKKAMGRIWGQSNGQMGERPSGTESPP